LKTHAKCPCCSCPEEDKAHIFKCPATLAVVLWNKALEELENWLVAVKIHPKLQQDIISGLQQWHDDMPVTQKVIEGLLAGALQDFIGWGIALEGCITMCWWEEQDLFLQEVQ